MTVASLALPKLQLFDADGNPLAGGFLDTYQAGTSTPLATYTDSTGGTPNANPVVLNSAGEADVWLTVGTAYKIRASNANSVVLWTVDNISIGAPSLDLAGYSATATQMRLTHDPGEVGSESLATTMAGELERLRFAQLEAKQALDPQLTYWYQSYVKSRLPGVNVRMYGAVGDGSTDDTAAVQAAITAGGVILFPPGRYKITATLTLTTGCVLRGMGSHPGAITNAGSDDAPAAVLEHHFSGDFLQITGVSGAVEGGVGHGLDNLLLRQHYGDGTSAAGKAIAVVAASDSFKPSWLHIDTVNCEVASGKDHWSYCLHQDADGTSGATQGTRDTWVGNGRFVSGSHSTAAVSLHCAVNWIAVNLRLDNLSGSNAIFEATGSDGTHASNTLFLSNVNGSAVSLDYANNVRLSNCAFTDFTSTAHSEDAFWCGGAITNAPTIAGTNVALLVLNSADNLLHLYNGGGGLTLSNASGQQKLVLDAEANHNAWVQWASDSISKWQLVREATTDNLYLNSGSVSKVVEIFQTGQVQWGKGQADKAVTPTYGPTVSIDCSLGNVFLVHITDGLGLTIDDATNARDGQEVDLICFNESGGAHGTISFASSWRLAGAGAPTIANGKHQTLTFRRSSALFREKGGRAGDITN